MRRGTARLGAIFWSPFLLACASAAFTIFWGATNGWDSTAWVTSFLTVVFVVGSYVAARKHKTTQLTGGFGGNAEALGEDSDAVGGEGGRGISGVGGTGGDALAKGKGSRAQGGRGGDA